MGQVSQLEDEQDRRDEALHLRGGELPMARARPKPLAGVTKVPPAPIRSIANLSDKRREELIQRGIERQRRQLAWRKELHLIRFEELNTIFDMETRTSMPIRKDQPYAAW